MTGDTSIEEGRPLTPPGVRPPQNHDNDNGDMMVRRDLVIVDQKKNTTTRKNMMIGTFE